MGRSIAFKDPDAVDRDMSWLGSKAKAPAEDKTILCPRDGSALAKITRDDVTIDRCESCGGLWFDAKELRRVAHDKEVEKMAVRVSEFAKPSPFPCPRCAGKAFESFVADVAVDTCSTCRGVWLDGGELEEAKRGVQTERLLSAAAPQFRQFLARL